MYFLVRKNISITQFTSSLLPASLLLRGWGWGGGGYPFGSSFIDCISANKYRWRNLLSLGSMYLL